MTRRRWLRAQWPFAMRVLADRLRSQQFTSETQNGFILDRFRADSIECRFIERQEISQIVESPLGQRTVYERTEFREIAFVATPGNSPGLEIANPPRSVSLFLSRLSEVCDFQVSISEVKVDVVGWCARLAELLGRPVDIVSCQLRDIKLADNATATAVIRGSSDVRAAANLMMNGNPYINDKVKIQIQGRPLQSAILTRQAAVTIDRNASDTLLDSLRTSLYLSST
ncbi:hypothetical protein [Mesorhizobium sp.]|uniref:hypothetical protein n=1 Tax=Mesorhizobium sp. TaxID=1871066 RepID=UPI000FE78958|nr:hypothetical protein [Mesorhizobium sp.]RWA81746.1 MAG: hypothetical protein EOQ30_18425 [Mesorhizobium sp.]